MAPTKARCAHRDSTGAIRFTRTDRQARRPQEGNRVGASGRTGGRQPSRNKISLRARTLNGDKLKVNDKRGNPIEIAAVVVWRVEDTAQAMFDVDNYENYVPPRASRLCAIWPACYAYDHGEDNEITLRSNVDEVSQSLRDELQERLAKAGVVGGRSTAHAPGLRAGNRTSHAAAATGGSRDRGAEQDRAGRGEHGGHGAERAGGKSVVHLDDERRAAMVSNLMVVLCGESEVHPVVNNRHALQLNRHGRAQTFLLRIDPALWAELEAWAQDELRSVNGQIEYLLKQAVQKRKGAGQREVILSRPRRAGTEKKRMLTDCGPAG